MGQKQGKPCNELCAVRKYKFQKGEDQFTKIFDKTKEKIDEQMKKYKKERRQKKSKPVEFCETIKITDFRKVKNPRKYDLAEYKRQKHINELRRWEEENKRMKKQGHIVEEYNQNFEETENTPSMPDFLKNKREQDKKRQIIENVLNKGIKDERCYS